MYLRIKKILIIFTLCGSTSVFQSCNNTLENFEILKLDKPLIVLNARLVARQSPRIYIGKSWGATAIPPNETFYRNAEVELFEDDKLVGKLILQDSLYVKKDYIVKANTNYKIKVKVVDVGSVESEPVQIPPDGVISKATYDTKTIVSSTGNTVRNPCLINLTFKKIDNVAGYGIDLVGYNDEGQLICGYNYLDIGRSTIIKSPCIIDIETPYIDLQGDIGKFTFGKKAYVGKCIDTFEKDVKLFADLNSYGFTNPTPDNMFIIPNPINKIIVCVTAVSNEVVEMAKTTRTVEGFTAALSEPYPTYSNIKGGLGIVTGYNVSYKILYIR